MLQCNKSPGLDANEIIRLTSAIGHDPSVNFLLQSGHSNLQQLRSSHWPEGGEIFYPAVSNAVSSRSRFHKLDV